MKKLLKKVKTLNTIGNDKVRKILILNLMGSNLLLQLKMFLLRKHQPLAEANPS